MKQLARFTLLPVVVFVGLSFSLSIFPVCSVAEEAYNWRLQSVWRTPATQDGLKLFAENVKKASNGKININRLEIARLDNDPNQPENGIIELLMEGGL